MQELPKTIEIALPRRARRALSADDVADLFAAMAALDPAIGSIEIDSGRDDGLNTAVRLNFTGAPADLDHKAKFLSAYRAHQPARTVTLEQKLAELPDEAACEAFLHGFLLARFGGEIVEIERRNEDGVARREPVPPRRRRLQV